MILDKSQPAIVRASALPLLGRYVSPASEAAIKAAIADPDPLVRMAAPQALPQAVPRALIQAILPLLVDPVRAVRVETARVIAGIDPQTMTPEQRSAFSSAYQELIAAEMIDFDRPESHLNLGLLKTRRQQLNEAEAEYRTALRLDPKFVPALVNLADLIGSVVWTRKEQSCCARPSQSNQTMPPSSMRSAYCSCASATMRKRYRCCATQRP